MKLFYYLKMLRAKEWMKSCFWIPLIGAVLVNTSIKNFIFIAVISFCVFSYGYAVNNYFDIEIDKKHKKKIGQVTNPLAQGLIAKKGVLIFLLVLLIVSFVLAIHINNVGFVFVLLTILFSTLYSIKYFRLKEKFALDIITLGLISGFFPFLFGVTLAGGVIVFPLVLIAILFMVLNSNFLLIHQITDYNEDFGKTKTTVIRIGIMASYICVGFLVIISLICFKAISQYYFINIWLYSFIITFLILWPIFWSVRGRILVNHSRLADLIN